MANWIDHAAGRALCPFTEGSCKAADCPEHGLIPTATREPVAVVRHAGLLGERYVVQGPPPDPVFMHDLDKPCACKTCETQLRLDAEAHAKRLAEEAKLAQERPTLDLRLDEIPAAAKHVPAPEFEMTQEEVNAWVTGAIWAKAKRAAVLPGYEKLAAILDEALERAQAGKGKERHANGKPFHEQPIVALNVDLGTVDGALYQVLKKLHESKRLPPDRRRAERLDAINYIVASILVDEELDANKP